MSAATLKPIRLECYLPRLPGDNKASLFQADRPDRYLLQCAWESSVVAMDKTCLIELVRDVTRGYTETDTTGMLSPPTAWRKQSEFVSSRPSGQIPAAVRMGIECRCNGQNVSNRNG
jgi:hypothetical protein